MPFPEDASTLSPTPSTIDDPSLVPVASTYTGRGSELCPTGGKTIMTHDEFKDSKTVTDETTQDIYERIRAALIESQGTSSKDWTQTQFEGLRKSIYKAVKSVWTDERDTPEAHEAASKILSLAADMGFWSQMSVKWWKEVTQNWDDWDKFEKIEKQMERNQRKAKSRET